MLSCLTIIKSFLEGFIFSHLVSVELNTVVMIFKKSKTALWCGYWCLLNHMSGIIWSSKSICTNGVVSSFNSLSLSFNFLNERPFKSLIMLDVAFVSLDILSKSNPRNHYKCLIQLSTWKPGILTQQEKILFFYSYSAPISNKNKRKWQLLLFVKWYTEYWLFGEDWKEGIYMISYLDFCHLICSVTSEEMKNLVIIWWMDE